MTDSLWQRTSPAAILFFLGKLLRGLFEIGWAMLVAGYGIVKSGNADYLLIAAGALLLVMAVWSVLSWWRFRYRLEDDRMMIKRGVIHLEQLTIEFARVQNTRVIEPFYLRPFGLALFKVDTAGSAQQEVTLGGVALPLAHALRDSIVARQQNQTPSLDESASEKNETSAVQATLTRSRRDIALYGLTHNGMFWVVAVLAAVFSQAGQSETWNMTRSLATLIDLRLWTGLEIALALLGLLLLLPLFSIAGSFWRYDKYQLFSDGDTWRRHSGLVSKHEESLKEHKIQSVIWQQNVVARMLGRINLKLKQATAGVGMDNQGNMQKRQSAFIIPALLPAEASELTAKLLPGSSSDQAAFSQVDRRYIRRSLFWVWGLPCALITTALSLSFSVWALFLWPLMTALGWPIAWQCWRRLGYVINGGYGYIRKGFLGSKTSVFPLFKVQRVDIRQTPNQRRRGLAHLTIHLASHSLTLPWIQLDHAQQIRDLALYHVETSRERWF